jgi:TonB-dependent receptor
MKEDNAVRPERAKLAHCIRLALTGISASALSVSALAQSANDDDRVEEVVVSGVRASLQTSQALKRNSDVFVDAVTATDIGALPDRSITEVLQRVPGVSISRFAGADDPDHFSVEGSGTVIRGIGFVRSELNGRDVFSADAGQALGFQNVSPELMGSVQVFKNQSADMIEGGIGGTVNLVTRKPFDRKDGGFSFSAESNYSDFKERWSPTVSGLWSDGGRGLFGAQLARRWHSCGRLARSQWKQSVYSQRRWCAQSVFRPRAHGRVRGTAVGQR